MQCCVVVSPTFALTDLSVDGARWYAVEPHPMLTPFWSQRPGDPRHLLQLCFCFQHPHQIPCQQFRICFQLKIVAPPKKHSQWTPIYIFMPFLYIKDFYVLENAQPELLLPSSIGKLNKFISMPKVQFGRIIWEQNNISVHN